MLQKLTDIESKTDLFLLKICKSWVRGLIGGKRIDKFVKKEKIEGENEKRKRVSRVIVTTRDAGLF